MGIKVVMEEIKDGKSIIGVSKEGCDPVSTTVEGDIHLAYETVPELLTEALERWATTPRNPNVPKEKPKDKPKEKPKAGSGVQGTATPATTEELPLLAGVGTTPTNELPTEAETPVEKAEDTGEGQTEAAAEPGSEPEAETKGAGPVAPAAEGETPSEVETEPATEPQEATSEQKEPGLYLKDGRGPYANVQAALDALGLPKDQRPNHNRYSRLSKDLQSQITVVE